MPRWRGPRDLPVDLAARTRVSAARVGVTPGAGAVAARFGRSEAALPRRGTALPHPALGRAGWRATPRPGRSQVGFTCPYETTLRVARPRRARAVPPRCGSP